MVKLKWTEVVFLFFSVICRPQSGQEEKSLVCSTAITTGKQVSGDVHHVTVLLKIHMP